MGHLDYQSSYRRNLPHLQPRGAIIFVTFRLTGSLPVSLLERWRQERVRLQHLQKTDPTHYARVASHFEKSWFAKFEAVLDGGSCGPLWLRDELVASQVADSLHRRDRKVYRLDAFSIMPNHVHVLFKPLRIDGGDQDYHSLASIMQSLKGFTARACNRLLKREGEFWAHESYDHFVRSNDEWHRIVADILNNPVKAGFVREWRQWRWNYFRE